MSIIVYCLEDKCNLKISHGYLSSEAVSASPEIAVLKLILESP